MLINTNDYIKLYNNCFETKTLESTIEELTSLKVTKTVEEFIPIDRWQSHTWRDTRTGEQSTREKQELESTKFISKNNKYFMDTVYKYIDRYMKDINHPYLVSWAGYNSITYHRYKKGTDMAAHVDHIQSIFDGTVKGVPILSVVGQLNDNFKGGEFQILDKNIRMKAGDILIFPSNFFFIHKVNLITKGTRLSFVSWVY